MCVFWGRRKRIKSSVLMEQFYDSLTVEKHLFFLYFERNFFTERVARASFFIFFFALLFRRTALSSFSLFLSLFSLEQLVCVFLLENSLHTNNFLAAAQSSNQIIVIFPLIIKV